LKETEHEFWVRTYLDKWREKFSFPLSRKQAAEILLDEKRWDDENKEYIDIEAKDIWGWVDAKSTLYKILKEEK
jgi:hypothetical protein